MSSTDQDADSDIDAAIAAGDPVHLQYVMQNRAFRRRVAIYLLIVFLIGGSAMIAAGLASDAVAKRVNELGSVIGTFMASIAALLSAYFGAGAFDNRSMIGGSMLGGGMYGGFGGPPFGGLSPRPRLTRSPAADPAGEMHRAPDAQ